MVDEIDIREPDVVPVVNRGYVIFPDPGGKYSVVAVREHHIAEGRRRVERLLTDRVAMPPDVALDAAIELWDETRLPVCLYLKNHGKVIFDDFWESVVGNDLDDTTLVMKYLGYTQDDASETFPVKIPVNERAADALRLAMGLDLCTPKPRTGATAHLAVPKVAIEMWREHAENDPSAQGLNYVVGHPITKAAIRAYFDLADVVPVKMAFDAIHWKDAAYGWYRHADDTAYINYGAFAPEYVLAVLMLGRYNVNTVIDAFAATIVHEVTHRAEWLTGFAYEGRWVQTQTPRGIENIPEGSELMAVGAEYTGGYALQKYDADHVRYHLREAFNCTDALCDIQGSDAMMAFGSLMDRVELVYGGVLPKICGAYVPFKYGPYLNYNFRVACPEENVGALKEEFSASDFDVSWTMETRRAVRIKAPPYEKMYADLIGDIFVPADDQTWIAQAYREYPDSHGHKNMLIE